MKLKAIQDLGAPDIQILTNQTRKNRAPFNLLNAEGRKFGGILKYAHLQNKQFLAAQPSFIDV